MIAMHTVFRPMHIDGEFRKHSTCAVNMNKGADQKPQVLEQCMHANVQAPLPACNDKAHPDTLRVYITGNEEMCTSIVF